MKKEYEIQIESLNEKIKSINSENDSNQVVIITELTQNLENEQKVFFLIVGF